MDWILANYADVLAYAGLFLAASTAGVPVLRRFFQAGQRIAARTVWKYDDGFFRACLVGLDYFSAFLEALVDLIPVISVGRLRRPPGTGSGLGVVGLVLVACIGVGCTPGVITDGGATPDEVQREQVAAKRRKAELVFSAIETSFGLLEAALVGPYQAKGAECDADPTSSPDCLRGWDITLDVVSSVRHTAALGVDGVAISDGGDPIVCLSEAVTEALQAVADLEVEIDPQIVVYLDAAGGLAATLGAGRECHPTEATP